MCPKTPIAFTELVPTIPADLDWELDLALQKCVMIYQAMFTSSSPVVRLLRGPHLLEREQVVSFQVGIPERPTMHDNSLIYPPGSE
jgi:hypothetical protein